MKITTYACDYCKINIPEDVATLGDEEGESKYLYCNAICMALGEEDSGLSHVMLQFVVSQLRQNHPGVYNRIYNDSLAMMEVRNNPGKELTEPGLAYLTPI